MHSRKSFSLVWILFSFLTIVSADRKCKAVPGTPSWPDSTKWKALNASVDGRLLQPPPPAAVCHSDRPEYNADACTTVTQGWTNIDYHATLPNSSPWNNVNNDSCLPAAAAPCSGTGYGVYVLNATCKEDVKKGIEFAAKNNMRLVIRGTGVDEHGR